MARSRQRRRRRAHRGHRRCACPSSASPVPLAADEMPAWRYGQALRAADAVVFHNRDDLALLTKLALVPARCRPPSSPAPASTSKRQPVLPLPPLGHGLVFLMIAQPRAAPRRPGILRGGEDHARQRSPACASCSPRCRPKARGDSAWRSLRSARERRILGPAADHARRCCTECHVFVYPSLRRGHAAAGAAGDGRRAADRHDQRRRLPRNGRRARQRRARRAARRRCAGRGDGELSAGAPTSSPRWRARAAPRRSASTAHRRRCGSRCSDVVGIE